MNNSFPTKVATRGLKPHFQVCLSDNCLITHFPPLSSSSSSYPRSSEEEKRQAEEEEEEEVTCLICYERAQVLAVQESCCHVLCSECLFAWRAAKDTLTCPYCRQESLEVVFADRNLRSGAEKSKVFRSHRICSRRPAPELVESIGALEPLWGDFVRDCLTSDLPNSFTNADRTAVFFFQTDAGLRCADVESHHVTGRVKDTGSCVTLIRLDAPEFLLELVVSAEDIRLFDGLQYELDDAYADRAIAYISGHVIPNWNSASGEGGRSALDGLELDDYFLSRRFEDDFVAVWFRKKRTGNGGVDGSETVRERPTPSAGFQKQHNFRFDREVGPDYVKVMFGRNKMFSFQKFKSAFDRLNF